MIVYARAFDERGRLLGHGEAYGPRPDWSPDGDALLRWDLNIPIVEFGVADRVRLVAPGPLGDLRSFGPACTLQFTKDVRPGDNLVVDWVIAVT